MTLGQRLLLSAAHASAAILLALAALLSLTELGAEHLAGLRRASVAGLLIGNAALLETYIALRKLIARSDWPDLALITIYLLNETALRTLSLLNIGIGLASLALAPDRWWLLLLVLLGAFGFVLARDFPDLRTRWEWSDRDVIRHFAQESPRYAWRLQLAQIFSGLAGVLVWLLSWALAAALLVTVGALAYAALLAESPPTLALLLESVAYASGILERIALSIPLIAGIAIGVAVITALYALFQAWWTRPRPIRINWPFASSRLRR